jgi:hypothetical protein
MDMKPQVAWAMAVVVFVMMAGAVTLKIFKEDISIIITLVTVLAVPVLAGFGFKVNENLQEIKTNTNGKNDKQMDINQKQVEMMHEMMARNNEALIGTIRQLQDQVTNLALQMTPPSAPITPVEPPRESDDHSP